MANEIYERIFRVQCADPSDPSNLPTATPGHLGCIGILYAATGADAVAYMCKKTAADAFAWFQLDTSTPPSPVPNPLTLTLQENGFAIQQTMGNIGPTNLGTLEHLHPDDPDALDWYRQLHSGNNGGSADLNWQLGEGFNQGGVGAIDASKPSGGRRIESHYQPATDWIMEHHVAVFIDPTAPATEIRAFDATHNFATHKTQSTTQTNQFSVQPVGGGTPVAEVDVDANRFRLYGSAPIELQVNNAPALLQRNQLDSAFIEVLRLNANNEIQLGVLGAATPILLNGELRQAAGFDQHCGQNFYFDGGGGTIYSRTGGGDKAVFVAAGGDVTIGVVGWVMDLHTTHLRLNPTGNLQFFGTGGGTTQAAAATIPDFAALKTYLIALGLIGP